MKKNLHFKRVAQILQPCTPNFTWKISILIYTKNRFYVSASPKMPAVSPKQCFWKICKRVKIFTFSYLFSHGDPFTHFTTFCVKKNNRKSLTKDSQLCLNSLSSVRKKSTKTTFGNNSIRKRKSWRLLRNSESWAKKRRREKVKTENMDGTNEKEKKLFTLYEWFARLFRRYITYTFHK